MALTAPFPPRTLGDILIFVLIIALLMLSIYIVDYLSQRGRITGTYLLTSFITSFIIVVVPPFLISILSVFESLFGGVIQFSEVYDFLFFIIAIYSVRYLLSRLGYESRNRKIYTGEGKRSWENAIWVSFFAFLVIFAILSFIDYIAANT